MVAYEMEVVIHHNRFPEIQRKMPKLTKDVVQATVLELYAAADPPVDTGNLKGFVTVGENYITWHAYYAGFVNYGTRNMEARPFVDNAVKEVRPMFIAAMNELAKSL